MSLASLPAFIHQNYEVMEWNHASAILHSDFHSEWTDICEVLQGFRLLVSDILDAGGNRSSIAASLDSAFYARGWQEKHFDTRILVDDMQVRTPTHKVDCFKNHIGLEVEWNNKDTFFDRDLNNFRLLFELRTVSVGVIITRTTELQQLFNYLGKGSSYGASTTHFDKLRPKITGHGGGGCPILAFGIRAANTTWT
ncbi:restriction endonuclease [Burkholderia cenocepacia]|nr:restriction endonuclease [Burkholderia cenocepacia]RQU77384.1 restriction endonuclease [Burkholderia cenocepacia]RQV79038.1 restriction endonuclease [Burkholderia cenocepacia]